MRHSADEDASELRAKNMEQLEGSELSPLLMCGSPSTDLGKVIRWMSLRKALRNFTVPDTLVPVGRKIFCNATFVLSSLLLILVACFNPCMLLLRYIRVLAFPSRSQPFIINHLLRPTELVILSLLSFTAMWLTSQACRYENFVRVSNYLVRLTSVLAMVVSIMELFIISPTCWVASFSPHLRWLCLIEHASLWVYIIRTYMIAQILLGVCFYRFDDFLEKTITLYYSFAPLFLVTGVHKRLHQVQTITTAHELVAFIQSSNIKDHFDRSLIKYAYHTLSTIDFKQETPPQFVFVGIQLQTLVQRIMSVVFGSFFPKWDRQYDVVYFGEVNDLDVPHGLGQWIDFRTNGERLIGAWENGFPCSPFRSYVVDSATSFISSPVIFGYFQSDYLRTGIADVECCVTGHQYKKFPQIVRKRWSPEEDGMPPSSSISRCDTCGLRPPHKPSVSRGTGIRWCLQQFPNENFFSMDNIGQNRPQQRNSKSLLILTPEVWSFNQSVLTAGCFFSFFGHTLYNHIVCFSQQADGFHLGGNGSLFNSTCGTSSYAVSSLQRFVTELKRSGGIRSLDVVAIGSACEGLVQALPLPHVTVDTLVMFLPKFEEDLGHVTFGPAFATTCL